MEEQEEKKELTPEQKKTRIIGFIGIGVTWVLFIVFTRWQRVEGPAMWIWFTVAFVITLFFVQAVSYAVDPDRRP